MLASGLELSMKVGMFLFLLPPFFGCWSMATIFACRSFLFLRLWFRSG
jgi:hypothetical protein